MANETILTTGKRKTAIAKVWLKTTDGNQFVVNSKPLDEFFGNHPLQKARAREPLAAAKLTASVTARVRGGGLTGQADAIRHGLARAIAQIDPKLRKLMRDQGFLTRDSRIVERKKPGRPKARKRFQFSKR